MSYAKNSECDTIAASVLTAQRCRDVLRTDN